MSTRSLVKVFEGSQCLTAVYRQSDGYPSGRGTDLAEFLTGLSIVNGISLAETRRIANGAGCLAAQLIAHEKTGPGGIYVYSPSVSANGCGAEWVYSVRLPGPGLPPEAPSITVRDVYRRRTYGPFDVASFAEFCKKEEA